MAIGAFVEPLVVVVLLFGGVYVNRNTAYKLRAPHGRRWNKRVTDEAWEFDSDDSASPVSRNDSAERGLVSPRVTQEEPRWRRREVGIGNVRLQVASPNTRVFRDYYLSRLLVKFPFLVEVWYWALIYWVRPGFSGSRGSQLELTKNGHDQVYQLGRAFTALTLVEGTVNVARHHALQLVHLEERLQIFWEPAIQRAFLEHDVAMRWINRIYSFIHIPGAILFLAWLYYYTTARDQVDERQGAKDIGKAAGPPRGPALFQARRRTMAVCNLLAFVVFTAWPCMPPRLLSDPNAHGVDAEEGRTYGFIDTVHGEGGESSVWTQNKFCNQYGTSPYP